MTTSLRHIQWGLIPAIGEHVPADMDELVEGWLNFRRLYNPDGDATDQPFWWAREAVRHLSLEQPALCLQFVTTVLRQPIPDIWRFDLAAGPLEDLLAEHGPRVIDEVERLAATDAVFRDTLRGIWRNEIAEDIWERLQAAHGHQPSP